MSYVVAVFGARMDLKRRALEHIEDHVQPGMPAKDLDQAHFQKRIREGELPQMIEEMTGGEDG